MRRLDATISTHEKVVSYSQARLSGGAHNGYTFLMSGKDSGFRIRIERDLRDKFVATCRAQDRPAAQVIREYMRRHISEHKAMGNQKASAGNDDKGGLA